MFYALAIGSMLGYVLQNLLLARYVRKIDSLTVALHRNLSLLITMSPLLIGATRGDFLWFLHTWKLQAISGILGGLYLFVTYVSWRSIAISVASAFTKATATILMVFIGWIFLGQTLSITALMLIGLVIIGAVLLGIVRNNFAHLDGRLFYGIALNVFSAFLVACTNAILAKMNEAGSPLVNGYFWEATILIGCAVLIGGRFLFQRTSIQRISLRQWLIIALCSAPTIAGTACYSMATLLGPVAVINSIGTGSLVFTSLLGWWWYGEKLHGKQWLAIGLVMAGIVGLKFV